MAQGAAAKTQVRRAIWPKEVLLSRLGLACSRESGDLACFQTLLTR
jgi:hypothetical protein